MWCVWGVHCLLFFEVLGYGEGWIVAISLCVLGDFIPWKWNNCLLVYGALIANTLQQQESSTVKCMKGLKWSRKEQLSRDDGNKQRSQEVFMCVMCVINRNGAVIQSDNSFSFSFLSLFLCSWKSADVKINHFKYGWRSDPTGGSVNRDLFALRVHQWNLVDVGFRCRLSPSASESLNICRQQISNGAGNRQNLDLSAEKKQFWRIPLLH